MTAPIVPDRLTRSKVGRRLREAYERVGEAQKQVRTKSAQAMMLRAIWRAIEEAEFLALEDVRHLGEERNRRQTKRTLDVALKELGAKK